MKTYIFDLIPKLQRFSQKLDNLTLLTNQHWVVIDDIANNKNVYIFRTNNELLISQNGKVERAKWEYIGNNSLLIDKKDRSYLFKHGFFDENILALKVDSKEEYAFLINENKFDGELNSLDKVFDFLKSKYIEPSIISIIENTTGQVINPVQNIVKPIGVFKTDKGEIKIELNFERAVPAINNKVYQNDILVDNGKFKIGFMNYILVKEGVIVDFTMS